MYAHTSISRSREEEGLRLCTFSLYFCRYSRHSSLGGERGRGKGHCLIKTGGDALLDKLMKTTQRIGIVVRAVSKEKPRLQLRRIDVRAPNATDDTGGGLSDYCTLYVSRE